MASKPRVMVKQARKAWERVRLTEIQLLRKMRIITRHIGHMVSSFPQAGLDAPATDDLTNLLDRYGNLLAPWAKAQGDRMVAEIAKRDETAWMRNSSRMGSLIRAEIATAPTGYVLQAASERAANLITSLPLEAAQRIRKLTLEARASGRRPADLIAAIQASGDVSLSRARLISRTETARTASMLTQVRAEHVGSVSYRWSTVKDSDVRKSHREMENKIVLWAEPPTLSDGTVGHAGTHFNCRCFPSPVFD